MKSVKLKAGNEMPLLGFGTWRLKGEEATESVKKALDTGYRHIDTADAYENHRDIAAALNESSVDREELFITSKVWRDRLNYEEIKKDIAAIPKASSSPHIKENYDIFGWDMPNEAMEKMDQLNKNNRIIDPGFGEFDY